ncbi:hypothetical protein BC941DRAFT_483464 [Chlamydoabsidia padenii]|nr:hypothetical protein BC941DRAFT_483464 [Chlamydoabsidia padenii]
MLASEHCPSSLYDSQYHSVKMESDYNFKQESDLILANKTNMSTDSNTTIAASSSSSPPSDMIAYQSDHQYQQQQQLPQQQGPWYQQQVSSNSSQNYTSDDLFYASLPPPPPPPMTQLFNFPSPLPKKKQLINRNHPRHRSANGILQQHAHYHYQYPAAMTQQQQQQFAQNLQRQTSSSTATSTQSPPPSNFNMTPTYTLAGCVTPNIQYASTISTSPTDSLFSAGSSNCTLKKHQHDDALKTPTSTKEEA